jgi:DNA-directed RNA polymerase specialized sigma24 family protein
MRQTIDMTATLEDPPLSEPAPQPLPPEVAIKIADRWPAVQKVALGVTRRLTKGSPNERDEAEDLVEKCFMALLEGRRQWDPDTDLTKFVCGMVGSYWTHKLRELERQAALDPHDTGGPPASTPNPEALLALKREHEARVAELDELAGEFAEDSLEREVIRLTREDITEPAAQAEELGIDDVNDIYNARRNLGNAKERLERARRKRAQLAQGGRP